MAILNEEQKLVQKMARAFAEKEIAPKAAYYDATEKFPWENVHLMRDAGLMGIPIDEAYEGAGLGTIPYLIAIEEISRACGSTGAILAVHTSAGAVPLALFGNDVQKQKYLPDLASGRKVGAFALTEPGAGSDAAQVATTALLEGESYVLNGSKCFITNGGAAETFIIFASVDRSKGVKGITAFIVEKGTPGFRIGKKELKMGIRASSTVELIFDNCRIPVANRLGKEGEGFKIAMVVLDGARIGIAAQAVGLAQGAYEKALGHSLNREQFGKPISANQAVSFMLADMAVQIEAARQLAYHAAELKDAGLPYSKEAAMAKTFASDMSVQVGLNAIQVMGGYGYSRECPVERMLRDAKITQLYEGTNQILRLVISKLILSGK